MLICRPYLGLMRTITDDYGAEFAVHSERVGNAYRVTDKVNIPDLQKKLQRRIDLVTENAQRIIRIVGTLADSTDATTSGIKGREAPTHLQVWASPIARRRRPHRPSLNHQTCRRGTTRAVLIG